jgi:hypothetical protein
MSARIPDLLEALDGPRLSEPAPYVRLVTAFERILYRPMLESDVGSVPIACQGNPDQVRDRIAHLGSSAVLAFDEGQHVGQLQFRRYEAGTRSPNGVWDPLCWLARLGMRVVRRQSVERVPDARLKNSLSASQVASLLNGGSAWAV